MHFNLVICKVIHLGTKNVDCISEMKDCEFSDTENKSEVIVDKLLNMDSLSDGVGQKSNKGISSRSRALVLPLYIPEVKQYLEYFAQY